MDAGICRAGAIRAAKVAASLLKRCWKMSEALRATAERRKEKKMTHLYAASGMVFQRNEFMKGYSDYERSWSFSNERYMAESLEEATLKIASEHGVHEDRYGLLALQDLNIE